MLGFRDLVAESRIELVRFPARDVASHAQFPAVVLPRPGFGRLYQLPTEAAATSRRGHDETDYLTARIGLQRLGKLNVQPADNLTIRLFGHQNPMIGIRRDSFEATPRLLIVRRIA